MPKEHHIFLSKNIKNNTCRRKLTPIIKKKKKERNYTWEKIDRIYDNKEVQWHIITKY